MSLLRADRRSFMRNSAAFAAGLAGLRSASAAIDSGLTTESGSLGYGPLVADPSGVLDLPAGFSYRVISRSGERMQDGLFVPQKPDGMATFAGPDGLTILMRNHECKPHEGGGFGQAGVLSNGFDRKLIYDSDRKFGPASGGVTTVVYDTSRGQVVRQFMSLAGTVLNCAGGPTPWGSWVTCEETVERVGDESYGFLCRRDHGYCFEAPATTVPGLVKPTPLVAMGRFRHEAIAVEPKSGAVYLTEDMDDGCLYRFLPNRPGKLAAGGRLQALAIEGQPSRDTRNWEAGSELPVGVNHAVRWIDMDHPESPDDDLRYRAFDAGAARFARAEGIWHCGDNVAFACTSGGSAQIGQIWRYTPSDVEGQAGEAADPGKLELFIEPNDSRLVHNADNLTASPWGDLVVCEDRGGDVVRLVGVTPQGECYELARNHKKTEFAGVVFSPDGTTLFVNLQHAGLTLAITGPWRGMVG